MVRKHYLTFESHITGMLFCKVDPKKFGKSDSDSVSKNFSSVSKFDKSKIDAKFKPKIHKDMETLYLFARAAREKEHWYHK